MSTKVVTFRLPEDLMKAITSEARATGKCKTAVVVDALKQVFGLFSHQTPSASKNKLHPSQNLLCQDVADSRQQPIEFSRRASSNGNTEHREDLEEFTAAEQILFDEISAAVPPAFSSANGGVSVDLANASEGVSQEPKSASNIHSTLEENLQQLAAGVEQRARILEQVLSASVDQVCMYDRLGRYTYANRAFLQSFQLERTELYGKMWQEVGLPAETMKSFGAKLQITLATGQSIAEEISLPTVNGIREYEYILSPIRSGDGSIEAVVYTARDITERKQAEEALRESEKNYRNLFEWAHDSIFITDSSTDILLDVNQHAARRLGYTRKQLLKLPAEAFSPPMDSKHRQAVLEQLWQTGSVVFEHIHRCKNGTEIPIEVSSRVVEYGGQLAIQSFIRDITARKQAEERLGLYQQIVNHAKEAIAILDCSGYYVEQNPAHRSLLGYSDTELLGRRPTFHLGAQVDASLTQHLLKNGYYCGEVSSSTKRGDMVDLEIEAVVIRNEADKPLCYVIFPRSKQALNS